MFKAKNENENIHSSSYNPVCNIFFIIKEDKTIITSKKNRKKV